MKTMTDEAFCKSMTLVTKLNSLSSSRVTENTIIFTEDLLDCKGVAFYILSEDERYLRLVAQSRNKALNFRIKKSLTLDKVKAIKASIESRNIFVNNEFNKELPKIMIPIVISEKVRAALAIYDDKLFDIEVKDKNIFELISASVTNALINAYTYENAIVADRYINNTGVLKSEYFKEIIENKEYFRINNNAEYTLIKLSHKLNNDIEYLYYNLKSQLRGMDYIGMDSENSLYLLLSNTSYEEAEFVIDRLVKRGFQAEITFDLEF